MLTASWKGWMEGHRQCSRLVGRVNGVAYTVLTASWKGWMEGHRQCSRLVGMGELEGIESAHR